MKDNGTGYDGPWEVVALVLLAGLAMVSGWLVWEVAGLMVASEGAEVPEWVD